MIRSITPIARPLGRLATALALVAAGCQAQPRSGGAITVAIAPGFATMAQTTHVDHYVARLYDTGLNTEVYNFPVTFTGGSRTVRFDNVAPGTYKAVVEAFADSGETFNLADPATVQSTGTATVAYTGVQDTQALTVNLRLLDDGPLAPDDAGNPVQTHLYQVTKNAVTSDFVWIPRFTAYALTDAANCGTRSRFGTADNLRPNGYWTASMPAAGQMGTQWQVGIHGGFYVGKYEACHEDATTSSSGSATAMAVVQGVPPWQNVDWMSANLMCRSYSPACRLMGDQEWGALAIWTMITNQTVKGNTNNTPATPDDYESSGASFVPWTGGVAKTGTGGTTTSHDGTSNGVYDLKGNLAEWTSDLKSDTSTWRFDDVALPFSMPTSTNLISSLDITSSLLGKSGIVGNVDGTGKAEFGFDGFVVAGAAGHPAVRGGSYATASAQAGIWCLDMSNAYNATSSTLGFRPVLRF